MEGLGGVALLEEGGGSQVSKANELSRSVCVSLSLPPIPHGLTL